MKWEEKLFPNEETGQCYADFWAENWVSKRVKNYYETSSSQPIQFFSYKATSASLFSSFTSLRFCVPHWFMWYNSWVQASVGHHHCNSVCCQGATELGIQISLSTCFHFTLGWSWSRCATFVLNVTPSMSVSGVFTVHSVLVAQHTVKGAELIYNFWHTVCTQKLMLTCSLSPDWAMGFHSKVICLAAAITKANTSIH